MYEKGKQVVNIYVILPRQEFLKLTYYFHSSHGHMDHISALPQHIKKRELLGSKPATYYVPEHIVQDVHELCNIYAKVCENSPGLEKPIIKGVHPKDKIKVYNSPNECCLAV